ncbi:receptor expression-enhancing protein 5-like [Centruroides sculpturatus]|uniref:receptor expression-enhancing protein 5-like n=1 Tax=Centruroides sculpturatus TaxID=218467 RepID=UPI000C6EC6AB|nr:receptor expression-enhancing protein 5-like [Centruroides sculpturatus]
MEIIVEILNKISTKLNSNNKYTRILGKVEEKCGCNRFYIVACLMIIVAGYTAVGYGNEIVCTVTSTVYPICASMDAMQRGTSRDIEIMTVYWMIFTLINLFEILFDAIVAWIPCYWMLKMLFLIFCYAPLSNNISLFFYRNILRGPITSVLVEQCNGAEPSIKSTEMETGGYTQEDCDVKNSDQEDYF